MTAPVITSSTPAGPLPHLEEPRGGRGELPHDPGFAEFARTHIAPRADGAYRAEILDRLSWQRLADRGLWRVGVPEHLGGVGGTWRDLAERIADIAREGDDLGFVLSLIAHAGLVRALVEHGGEYHHRTVLPSLMKGAVGATALTEPHGGSDVARTRTTAVRTPEGWSLTGLKDHITNAPVADRALILGRVPELGRRDITLFLVNLHSPGVRRGPAEELLGLRTSPTGAIHLEDVALPEGAVLGAPGEGCAPCTTSSASTAPSTVSSPRRSWSRASTR